MEDNTGNEEELVDEAAEVESGLVDNATVSPAIEAGDVMAPSPADDATMEGDKSFTDTTATRHDTTTVAADMEASEVTSPDTESSLGLGAVAGGLSSPAGTTDDTIDDSTTGSTVEYMAATGLDDPLDSTMTNAVMISEDAEGAVHSDTAVYRAEDVSPASMPEPLQAASPSLSGPQQEDETEQRDPPSTGVSVRRQQSNKRPAEEGVSVYSPRKRRAVKVTERGRDLR